MKYLVVILIAVSSRFCAAQPIIQWQKTLGGGQEGTQPSTSLTSDDGLIVSGHTTSTSGDISATHFAGSASHAQDPATRSII